MNIQSLAAEIARAIPELARDSQVNNADYLERLIYRHTCGDGFSNVAHVSVIYSDPNRDLLVRNFEPEPVALLGMS